MKTVEDLKKEIDTLNKYYNETGKFHYSDSQKKKHITKIALLNNLIQYVKIVNPTQDYLLNEIIKLKAKQNLWIEQGNAPDQVIKQQIKNFEYILN